MRAGCDQDRYDDIDLLVNNAGAGYLGLLDKHPSRISKERWTSTSSGYGVLLKLSFHQCAAGQVASLLSQVSEVSSDNHLTMPIAQPSLPSRDLRKAWLQWLNGWALMYASLKPGAVNTEFVMSVQAPRAELTQELQKVYSPMLDKYLSATRLVFAAVGQTPEDIGHVIVEAATQTRRISGTRRPT